jgi:ABC-type Fe3+-hydroxamate transport system substrate-binding protein
VHPADAVAALPKVGGTKDTDVAAVCALAPDLVLANHEENTRRSVEKLRAAGLTVWVTYPRSVREGAELLARLADLGADAQAFERIVTPVRAELQAAERVRGEPRVCVFCPIWRDPWMTVGSDTYIHDLLELCGGRNPFAAHGDRRYPRIALEDVVAAAPDVVLLPDEPYRFGPADADELAGLPIPAARDGRIHLVDGTLVSWYGPRIARAIRHVRSLLAPVHQADRPPLPGTRGTGNRRE